MYVCSCIIVESPLKGGYKVTEIYGTHLKHLVQCLVIMVLNV